MTPDRRTQTDPHRGTLVVSRFGPNGEVREETPAAEARLRETDGTFRDWRAEVRAWLTPWARTALAFAAGLGVGWL